MSEPTIYLSRPDDETLEIRVDETEIVTVTHDSHGWAGIELAEKLVREIAELGNIRVVEVSDEEE